MILMTFDMWKNASRKNMFKTIFFITEKKHNETNKQYACYDMIQIEIVCLFQKNYKWKGKNYCVTTIMCEQSKHHHHYYYRYY